MFSVQLFHNFKITESGGLVVTSRTLIREVPGSIPGASYLGGGIVVVLHHQANAGVVPLDHSRE